MARRGRHVLARSSFLWPVIGLIFTIVGLIFAIVVPITTGRDIARVERLPPLTAGELAARPVGTEVLVEGRIDDRTPIVFRSFVAYEREEYRGRARSGTGGTDWFRDERVTPPLVLELSPGLVRVANDGYHLGNTPVKWQESAILTWDSARNEGTKRYRALERGDAVVAIGTVVDDAEGRAITAELVTPGTRASYIADARRLSRIFVALGAFLGAIGVLVLAWGARRFLRSPGTAGASRRR